MPDQGYDAFISYRRSDGGRVAQWLRRELEGFRLPKALRGPTTRKLKVYLDVAFERGTIDFYEHSVKPSLLASRHLIVLATPDAVRRREGAEDWVAREVADFSAGPNNANVMVVRAAGEFNGPLPADLAARFPNIEIVDLRGASRWSFLNPFKASRLASEKLKLVAPLLGLAHEAMPQLRQEEERRQQARAGAATGFGLAVLTAVSATSIYAVASSIRATRALEDSMFATGRMVITAATDLERETANRQQVRSNLLSQGCDLIDKLGGEAGTSVLPLTRPAREPDIHELVICSIERARARERLSEHEAARREFLAGLTLAEQRHDKLAQQATGLRVLEARRALADYHRRQKDVLAAEAELVRLSEAARKLNAQHGSYALITEIEASALGTLGELQVEAKKHAEAARRFAEAGDALATIERPEPGILSWQMRLYRLAGEQRLQIEDAAGGLAALDKALAAGSRIDAGRATNAVLLERAHSGALAFELYRRRGNLELAERLRVEALALVERVSGASQASAADKQRAGRIKAFIDARGGN